MTFASISGTKRTFRQCLHGHNKQAEVYIQQSPDDGSFLLDPEDQERYLLQLPAVSFSRRTLFIFCINYSASLGWDRKLDGKRESNTSVPQDPSPLHLPLGGRFPGISLLSFHPANRRGETFVPPSGTGPTVPLTSRPSRLPKPGFQPSKSCSEIEILSRTEPDRKQPLTGAPLRGGRGLAGVTVAAGHQPLWCQGKAVVSPQQPPEGAPGRISAAPGPDGM